MAIATGTALLGAAAIGAGASILGGKANKKAADKAAGYQLQINKDNNALARENRNVLTGYIDPYNKVGLDASNALTGAIAQGPYNGGSINSKFLETMDPGSFTNYRDSTGYQFRLGQGMESLQTDYAAKGALQSGAAMKDVVRFGQDFASGEYEKWRNALAQYGAYSDQFNNQERGYKTDQHNTWLNLLGNQQNVGLGAVNALAGVNNNATNQMISSNNQAAAAQSNAALMKGAANQQMWAGIGGAAGNALGYYANPGAYGYA